MELKYRIYTTMARLAPKRYRKHLEQMLVYAGEKRTVDFWVGSTSILAVLVFIIMNLSRLIFLPVKQPAKPGFIPLAFPSLNVALALISFLVVQFLVYLVIYFKAADRTKRVEQALPDALQLMSANLRAGMTPFQAVKLSARKEFGPLKEEIEYATTKAFGTESFGKALVSMTRRVKSPMLDRAMKLFTASMKSGGHLAQLLEDLANDIAETSSLKKELVTNTKMYSMLIMFMVIIGAPLLLAVSIHLIRIISDMQVSTEVSEAGFGMAFLVGTITLAPDFLIKASIIVLFITSLLASMLMGVIAEGSEKHGLRYAPLAITASLIAFAFAEYIISSLLQI